MFTRKNDCPDSVSSSKNDWTAINKRYLLLFFIEFLRVHLDPADVGLMNHLSTEKRKNGLIVNQGGKAKLTLKFV